MKEFIMYYSQKQVISAFKEKIEKILDYSIRDNSIKFIQKEIKKNPTALDFNDSDWQDAKLPFNWDNKKDAWFRKKIIVPAEIDGISVKGSDLKIRGRSIWANPVLNIHTKLYIDEKEALSAKNYMDFSFIQEVSKNVKISEEHILVINTKGKEGIVAFYSALPLIEIHYTKIDEIAFDLQSFIEELRYAESLPKGKEILDKAFKNINPEYIQGLSFVEILNQAKDIRKKISSLKIEAKRKKIKLIGHAHIDMNWLWPMEETIDVCKNTFDTVISLMDKYPDFCFSQSQAFTYYKMEQNYPDLFEKMKSKFKVGKLDITASSWVELDLNLSNEEAIVRQILYAKRYMSEKFDFEPRVFWSPDTFGHPWSMPQILKKSGVDYYYFMRGSKREHDLFWWEGPDKSKILVFNSSYLGNINPGVLVDLAIYAKENFNDDLSMFLYGVGNHGGGPTAQDIEMINNLNKRDIFPTLEFSTTHSYFDSMSLKKDEIPTIRDEFNPIFDGCYTTHWDIKINNRKCERGALFAEFTGTVSKINGGNYPELDKIWHTTMFNQFHDILPGSAIEPSYDYSNKIAEEAINKLKDIVNFNLKNIAEKIIATEKDNSFLVFNSLAWEREDIVYLDLNKKYKFPQVFDESGNSYSVQIVGGKIAFIAKDIPALGYKVFFIKEGHGRNFNESDFIIKDGLAIENEIFKLRLDKEMGVITYLYDKRNKKTVMNEFTSEGAFPVDTFPLKLLDSLDINIHSTRPFYNNMLQVLYEKPHPMSAWVIGPITEIKNLIGGAEIKVLENGPVLGQIQIRNKIDKSTLVQIITIYKSIDKIDVKTVIDWNQKGDKFNTAPMLKVLFTPILKNIKATFDIPFANIERVPDGREYPAQKYVDISDSGYGLSILSDTKHGFSVEGNTISMTLIRASYEPDPDPDSGIHDFLYSIYPHKGDFKQGDTVRKGYELNFPLLTSLLNKDRRGGNLPLGGSYIKVDNKNIIVTSFKKSMDIDDIILRFYECHGKATKVDIKIGFTFKEVFETDLIERPIKKIEINKENKHLALEVSPYEIRTFRFKI